MAQLEGSRRYTETPTPETPKAQHSPTFKQLLQADASWQSSTSPTLARNHDPDEDFNHLIIKKSVFTRVKEKARKLSHSLSAKKKHDNEILDGQTTPSWGVVLEDNDDDEEEEDPEYLGAPMYESELSPEAYKENARQHPRADPVVSEKHLWPTSIIKREDEEKDKPAIHSKTITETVSEKLAPAYAAVSDATHTIASKITGLTISSPKEQQKHRNPDMEHFTADGMKNLDSSSEIGQHLSNKSSQKWDKGVSVKEYFMNKLEPGEDEKALSQVISEAVSPKKGPRDMGTVERVREAVASFLRHEEHPQSAAKGSVAEPSKETIKATNLSENIPISTKTEVPPPPPNLISSANTNSLSHVPISHTASSMKEPDKETTKATNLSSNSPISTKTVVSPPNSISSINVNSSHNHVSMSPRASSTEEPSKERIKATNLSSNIPISTKPEIPPPNFTSSTSVNTSSHVPFSPGASSVEEPWMETAKATNMSSNIPLFIRTEVPPLNSFSSTNVNSSSHVPSPRSASSKEEPSRETMKATNLSSHNPLWIKTEVPPPSSISSANVNPMSSVPLFRSASLSSHVPVFHDASSSPLIPISTNAQENVEEQTQGRILQAN